MQELIAFVRAPRERSQTEHGNIFALSLSKVIRHWRFLEIIHHRHTDASAALAANTQALSRSIGPGRGTLTTEQITLHEAADRLSTAVHLEVESGYLFAKILLDEIAHAIEYYFGPARNLALNSHDNLSKNLLRYSEAKGLEVPTGLEATIVGLKKRISDYRDTQIAHEKSLRTIRGTMSDQKGARMVMTRLYPTETDRQVESESVDELKIAIEAYIHHLLNFIERNSAKTRLE